MAGFNLITEGKRVPQHFAPAKNFRRPSLSLEIQHTLRLHAHCHISGKAERHLELSSYCMQQPYSLRKSECWRNAEIIRLGHYGIAGRVLMTAYLSGYAAFSEIITASEVHNRNFANRLLTHSRRFSSHSQMIAVRQPKLFNSAIFAVSRRPFCMILLRQYSAFAFGIRAPRTQSCPCQKHPCTKITLRNFGNTRSGFPGRSLRCNRYL